MPLAPRPISSAWPSSSMSANWIVLYCLGWSQPVALLQVGYCWGSVILDASIPGLAASASTSVGVRGGATVARAAGVATVTAVERGARAGVAAERVARAGVGVVSVAGVGVSAQAPRVAASRPVPAAMP